MAPVHFATFEDVVPHLATPSAQTLAFEGNEIPIAVEALLPQRHWQIPRFATAVSPPEHVMPAHGSKYDS